MIIKASQRGGARQLALHLLNAEVNEHVEVHEISGFVSENVEGALREIEAISRGTRCKQHMFSVSLSPPPSVKAGIDIFEQTIDEIEDRIGLQDQPRLVVYHEKEGRRHAHVVWSRIDATEMKAINLPFFKNRLMEISRELFLEHEWNMPPGLIDREQRNPLNFTRAQYEQAKRKGDDPRIIKAALKECWMTSDSRASFEHALDQRGYYLARGDRRGYVAVDWRGEIYSLSRWTDIKTRDLKARLGPPAEHPSVEEITTQLDQKLGTQVNTLISEIAEESGQLLQPLYAQRARSTHRHKAERDALSEAQVARWAAEVQQRQDRLNKGLRAIWDRITGRHHRRVKENERDAYRAKIRDRVEKDNLVVTHLEERQQLQGAIDQLRGQYHDDVESLKDRVFAIHPDERQECLAETFRQAHQRHSPQFDQNTQDFDFDM